MLPTIITLALGIAGLSAYLYLRFRWTTCHQEHRRVFNALVLPNVAGETFRRRESASLPSPAARYINHSIAKGTALSRMVDLHLVGHVRGGRNDEWLSFEARERIRAGFGFLWQARVEGIGRFPLDGADYYLDGEGRSEYFFGGLLPVSRKRGSEVTRSAAGHLLIESIWLPATLLPSKGARWSAGDDEQAMVSIAGHPDKSALNIRVAENGALKQVSMMRHQMGAGHSGLASFGYRVEEECTFGGYTIPGRIVGSWHVGTDDAYDYLDLKVETALYY